MGSITSRSKGGSSKGGSGDREYGQIKFELITAVEMDKVLSVCLYACMPVHLHAYLCTTPNDNTLS